MAKHCGEKGCDGNDVKTHGLLCICLCPACEQANDEFSRAHKVMHGTLISETPGVCGGRPCIEGTRITAAMIYELARTGSTHQEIKDDLYPHLELVQIEAAVDFVSKHIEHWLDFMAQYMIEEGNKRFAAEQERFRKLGLIDADGKAIDKEWPPGMLRGYVEEDES
jgi:uncharacterized protein (DUF433 family)